MSVETRANEIVKLLQVQDRRLIAQSYVMAENLAAEMLDASPSAVLDLLLGLIAAGVANTTIGLDLVSFIAAEDLPKLVQACIQSGMDSPAVTAVVEQIALQQPDAVPQAFRDEMIDFQFWDAHGALVLPALHLIFEDGAKSQSESERATRHRHPTWHLQQSGPTVRFGGRGESTCPSCGQLAIHLITLDQKVSGILHTDDVVVIEACPTCWGEAYFHHDPDGRPTRMLPIETEGYRYENVLLVERRIRLAPTPDRWLRQSWGHSNDRQNLCKIGGLPSWIQHPNTPTVPGTTRKMSLLLQLDSGFVTLDGRELLWGSGGLLYVFWDAETRTSCVFGQWT
jgi:hypothetical protein